MTAAAAKPESLDDLSVYERRPDVLVFCEHDRRDKQGNLVKRFRKAELEQIAAACNRRDQLGSPCPLTLGHTKDDAPESEQPPIVGYARRFRAEYDAARKRHVIRADYYIRRDRMAEAKEYPRSSVEYWGKNDIFDPIALLKRTPELDDLGQWTYHARHPERYRYSAEASMPDNDPTETPDAEAPDADEERMIKCLKKHFPHLEEMHKKYAAGFPGDGNTFIPTAGKEKSIVGADNSWEDEDTRETDTVKKMAKQEPGPTRFDRQRVEELERENKQLRAAYQRQERKAVFQNLVEEGYILDIEDELTEAETLTPAQFAARVERMKLRYQRDPAAGASLAGFTASTVIGQITKDQRDAAVSLATREGISFDAALAKTLGG